MKQTIRKVSLSILILSALIYVIGRGLGRDYLSDDVGDWLLWSGGISAVLFVLTITLHTKTNTRSAINIVIGSLIVGLTAFGLWGLLTSAGRREFPEMAALVPYYAVFGAGILFSILLLLNILWRISANQRNN